MSRKNVLRVEKSARDSAYLSVRIRNGKRLYISRRQAEGLASDLRTMAAESDESTYWACGHVVFGHNDAPE